MKQMKYLVKMKKTNNLLKAVILIKKVIKKHNYVKNHRKDQIKI